MRPLTDWLPITRDELPKRGWFDVDIVIVTGDAYVDHPSFGAAVIGRVLEHEGYKVAILPQPNWKDDLRDFKKFGKPRLFFGVTAGCMDSMVNHYTAAKRLRSDDAYTPNNQAGFRPDYPTVIYTRILKQLYPDTPVILGGIEASLRRFSHYDYWQNTLMPSILIQSGADLLVYGMGEKPIVDIAQRLDSGKSVAEIRDVLQTGFVANIGDDVHVGAENFLPLRPLRLHSYENCLSDPKKSAENFRVIETESNKILSVPMIQNHGEKMVVVNPPYSTMTTAEIDAIYDLPYTRLPHPKYNKRGVIPAYEMIRHSINIHRGCFGGCAFCTISAHQGKQIVSRSETSILKEVENVVQMDDFKGHLSDLGGPSANMWKMCGKTQAICEKCEKYSCIHPVVCKNLNVDHTSLIDLYKRVSKHSCIKKIFIGSGIRYDLFDEQSSNPDSAYATYLIQNCVSGRLKVAPEHTEPHVLQTMRKPSFDRFVKFKAFFDNANRRLGLRQQLIPYFISSHPNCTEKDMKQLAEKTKTLGYRLEAVQDFTPTPMTLATEMYYTGYDPYTMKKIYCAKTPEDKRRQNQAFFWWKNKNPNIMKKFICLLVLCSFTLFATAQKLTYRGYSGSMFAHGGKIKSRSFDVTNSQGEVSTYKIDKMEFGVGGKMTFQFGDYLRFGAEGYNSKVTYGDHKSSYNFGWGGLSADFLFIDRVVSYFAGATLGFGRATNTVITEPQTLNYQTSEILRRRYGVGILDPFMGAEVRLNDKLLVALKIDYVLRFTNTYDDWGGGLRVYLGMTFRPKVDTKTKKK